MQLESKRIESIIHYWIFIEENKLRQQQLKARDLAIGAISQSHDNLHHKEYTIPVRQKF